VEIAEWWLGRNFSEKLTPVRMAPAPGQWKKTKLSPGSLIWFG
jgi:hypothetical protein